MKLSDLFAFEVCCLMYGVMNNSSPHTLGGMIERREQHRYPIRDRSSLARPTIKHEFMRKDLSWVGPLQWNRLPEHIRSQDYKQFKNVIHEMFLADYWLCSDRCWSVFSLLSLHVGGSCPRCETWSDYANNPPIYIKLCLIVIWCSPLPTVFPLMNVIVCKIC